MSELEIANGFRGEKGVKGTNASSATVASIQEEKKGTNASSATVASVQEEKTGVSPSSATVVTVQEKKDVGASVVSVREEGNAEPEDIYPEGGFWGWSTLLGAQVVIHSLLLVTLCETSKQVADAVCNIWVHHIYSLFLLHPLERFCSYTNAFGAYDGSAHRFFCYKCQN